MKNDLQFLTCSRKSQYSTVKYLGSPPKVLIYAETEFDALPLRREVGQIDVEMVENSAKGSWATCSTRLPPTAPCLTAQGTPQELMENWNSDTFPCKTKLKSMQSFLIPHIFHELLEVCHKPAYYRWWPRLGGDSVLVISFWEENGTFKMLCENLFKMCFLFTIPFWRMLRGEADSASWKLLPREPGGSSAYPWGQPSGCRSPALPSAEREACAAWRRLELTWGTSGQAVHWEK